MKIVGAEWTSSVNLLLIKCDCGSTFKHRSDRWRVKCPFCYKRDDLGILRHKYANGERE